MSEKKIKDSGDRRQFESGAVRDMSGANGEPKGRFDLMPFETMAQLSAITSPEEARFFNLLGDFQKTGDTVLLLNAINLASAMFGWSMHEAFLEVAIHFEEGAKKYGENNWQKGIPVYSFIDSAARHFVKVMDNWKDEPHERAVIWNLMCAVWTCDNKPELNPYHKTE